MDRGAQRGAAIDLRTWRELPDRALLFGEAQARAIVTTRMPDTLTGIAYKHGVPARVIGKVGAIGAPLTIATSDRSLRATFCGDSRESRIFSRSTDATGRPWRCSTSTAMS